MISRISLLFTCCFLMMICNSRAQEYIRCATTEVLDQYELQFPGIKAKTKEAQAEAIQWAKDHDGQTRSVITVPVVVHVIYHTNSQNISDEQVKSQIDVLNEDYSKSNADASKVPEAFKAAAANCMIQFCLAAYDPNGDSTSGITRTSTDIVQFSTGDSMKYTSKGGEDAWPAKHYLNIWTCNLGGKILGYATLPNSGSGNSKSDGVVVLYKAFGREGTLSYPYNQGRTCTHEVGHWLGMYHIWGDDAGACDGSDAMDDTPNQGDWNFGCPVFPKTDNCSPDSPGVMFMNYMDYTDDRCMYMFTNDQAVEMTGVLNGSRLSIQSSPAGCQGVHFGNDAAAVSIIYPEDTIDYLSFQPQVQITNRGLNNLTTVTINYQVDGQTPPEVFQFTGDLPTNATAMVTLPAYFTGEGDHISTAWTSMPNGQQDEYIYNDTTTKNFTVRSIIAKNSLITSPSPSSGLISISIQNPGAGDMDLLVVNTLGQVIQHHFISALAIQSDFAIDLSNEPSGVYFLYAQIGYDALTKKVMVWR